MYPYGLIGNCQASALVSQNGSVDWLCLPQPDSPPVFGRLLDPDGGHFSVELESGGGMVTAHQEYLPNTNVLVTHLSGADGAALRITDFFPRFAQHGRMYRPNALFRTIEPVSRSPAVRISCRPVSGWEKQPVTPIRGNSHLRWDMRNDSMRLVTNMPLTYLLGESVFTLTEPIYLALTWGFGIEEELPGLARRFLDQTVDYWRTWVKHCSIPTLYQRETIRSALALKLHCYEDTGAILAALTTSLPEENGNGRNWDYRFCWLRDSYFVLSALHNLGHFEEMEGFLKFLLNMAQGEGPLHPVYRLDLSLPLPEREISDWAGFQGNGPVRENNQAAEHTQNDVYGEMILTLAPIFLDERFYHLRTAEHQALIARLARSCENLISKPDAGLWELRNGWQEHSFSNLMHWAGLERASRMQAAGFLTMLDDVRPGLARAEAALLQSVVGGSLRNGPIDPTFDAALLQLPLLAFPDKNISQTTVIDIARELAFDPDALEGYLHRYRRHDDFGTPKAAFVVCSFWLVQSLARMGHIERAEQVMRSAMVAANGLGLFAEHFIPAEKSQRGNFPQAYSHVGQINAAFAISPSWNTYL